MYDESLMILALEQAIISARAGEVPVGALLVGPEENIIASAGNKIVRANDPSGHAEMRVLRKASKIMKNYRLPGTTMYVTLEPCAMCAAAMVHARIARLVFGATDPKTGAIVSKYQIGTDGLLNHKFTVTEGVLANECSLILKEFFQKRR